jgi:predicted DNA-binding antitoxin AbrB/MazE fold protein
MRQSLRALLAGVIDYAGLFPPAKLPLDEAIRNDARYRREPEGWMLGRFVCPASRLAELAPFHDELFTSGPPFVFSALGRGGPDAEEFVNGLRDDLHDIAAFRDRHGAAVEVDVLEAKLPAEVLGADRYDAALALLGQSARVIEELGPPVLKPFYEVPLREGWQVEIEEIIEVLDEDTAAADEAPRKRCRQAGLKLRCGGVDAAAFPTPEQIAWALVNAQDREVPMKFTAGLHHPLRRFDAGVQTHMHGFLNVLLAGVFAGVETVDEDGLVQILLNEDPAHFAFDDNGVRWEPLSVDLAGIERARRELVLSFGSCSFDEPRDDLRALGLLG